MDLLLLFGGIFLLIKGSDWFVDGASDIAKIFKIPSLVIGLTIVAFGTSAPEAAVSISASLSGSSGVAIGNVIGSNIFNLLAVVGVSACIRKLYVERSVVTKDFPFNIVATVAMIVACLDTVLSNSATITVSRTDGLLLLCFFSVFMYYTIYGAIQSRINMEVEKPSHKTPISLLMLFGGVLCVILGGKFTVDGACNIARALHVSENMIALTIVAIGTSLPELVTSVTALRKGESDIAMGNVVGSNIFNLLFIIGISSAIRPLTADVSVLIDSVILMAVTLGVYGIILKKKSFDKISGATMIIMYIAFAVYVVMRGIGVI